MELTKEQRQALELIAAFGKDIEETAEVVALASQQFVQEVLTAWETAFPVIREFVTGLHDYAWEVYQAVGAPYGDNTEGMWRWLHESAEAKRLEMQAQEIREHHQSLVDMQRILTARR